MKTNPIYETLIFPAAEQDLLDIKEYFETKLYTSPDSLFQKVYNQIDLIERNPFMYPLVKDTLLSSLGYHIIPIDNYLLFYVVNDKTIEIHRFLFGKRNYLSILK